MNRVNGVRFEMGPSWIAGRVALHTQPLQLGAGAASTSCVFICRFKLGRMKRSCHKGHRTELNSAFIKNLSANTTVQLMHSGNGHPCLGPSRYAFCLYIKLLLLLLSLVSASPYRLNPCLFFFLSLGRAINDLHLYSPLLQIPDNTKAYLHIICYII